ncbi:MAG: hypothetical protein KDB22_04450 [Planctomycetales bacterium]|nr:hypothetical protein [Planctomycetales bacterium]
MTERSANHLSQFFHYVERDLLELRAWKCKIRAILVSRRNYVSPRQLLPWLATYDWAG